MEKRKHLGEQTPQFQYQTKAKNFEVKQCLEKLPGDCSTLGNEVDPTDPLIVMMEESSPETSQSDKYSSQEGRHTDTSVESSPSKVVAIEPLEDADEANALIKGVFGINRQILVKNPHILNRTPCIIEDQVDIASAKVYIMEKHGDPTKPMVQFNELVTKGNLKKMKLEEEALRKASEIDGTSQEIFKKPNLGFAVGPMRGKVAGKLRTLEKSDINMQCATNTSLKDRSIPLQIAPSHTKIEVANEMMNPSRDGLPPLPYNEPSWSGYPTRVYGFEVVRGGQIIEQFDLSLRSSHSIGRSPTCDIALLHPTISRYHVIMQYRDDDKATPENPPGFYVYDLGSTHGTFLNKSRIKSKVYVRVHVGHILKFGCSTRYFVLTGPDEDEEEESDLSVTQIQMQRTNELIRRKVEKLKGKKEEDDHGINWGMDDDADEETDLTVNPFASTNNEELYLDDPKKTLRGWFEREGHELVYDVEEKASGQFLCQIELPVESARGGIYVAEALVKGKKKEAVLQCALEACRVLDRYGLLRQATHESKKRKAKDWEADDFYDSDDDTFLDRTGAVEKKRKARIESLTAQATLTYTDLMKQHDAVMIDLQEAEARLLEASSRKEMNTSDKKEVQDELDEYMSTLSNITLDKTLISQIKSRIIELKREEARLRKLVNLVRPSDLPGKDPGRPRCSEQLSAETMASRMAAICRKAKDLVKSKKSATGSAAATTSGTAKKDDRKVENQDDGKDEVEYEDEIGHVKVESEMQISRKDTSDFRHPQKYNTKVTDNRGRKNVILVSVVKIEKEKSSQEDQLRDVEINPAKLTTKQEPFKQDLQEADKNVANDGQCIDKRTYTIPKEDEGNRFLKRKAESQTADEEIEAKMLMSKANDNKCIDGIQAPVKMQEIDGQTLEREGIPGGSKEAIVTQARLEKKFDVREGKTDTEELQDGTDDEDDNEVEDKEEAKRKKKNRKRIMQRNVKSMKERHAKWAELDSPHELFSNWTPPEGQSGDGRTSHNDRLGY